MSKKVAPRMPCMVCGGEKPPGKGSRLCPPCREARIPLLEQIAKNAAKRKAARLRRENAEKGLARHLAADAPEGLKWCPGCDQYLSKSQFTARSGRTDGLSGTCRPCMSEYLHARRLAKEFNLTPEQYADMLIRQDGRCAICFARPKTRRLAVDHDHSSGEIRGLLCTRCNHKVLGAAREDPAILRRAARYLEEPPVLTGRPLPRRGESALLRVEVALREAADNGTGLPLVVHRPDGMGPASIADWPVTLRLSDAVALLRAAGYGGEAELP